MVLEVIIHWADDPNYQCANPSTSSSYSYANIKFRSYFPLDASHFDHAHKWGPQTAYGDHLPFVPALPSSNTFCVPDDSDIEELAEETYAEDLEELNDSDVEEVTMAVFSPQATKENVIKVNNTGGSATTTSNPAETCDIKNITNPYPSPTYPTSTSGCFKLTKIAPENGDTKNNNTTKKDDTRNDQSSSFAVEVDSPPMMVPPVISEPEDNSEDNSEDDMESDSDDSQWPEVWNNRRSDDETDDIEGESYQEDESDESGEISDGSEGSDDGSEPELEDPKPESTIIPEPRQKFIDPGLLMRPIKPSNAATAALSTPTAAATLPTPTAAVSSSNTLDQVKTEESRESNSRVQLPPLEESAAIWPNNIFLESPIAPYPRAQCNVSSYFSVADRIYDPVRDPIQNRNTQRATYTDGPFQSPVGSDVPVLIHDVNQVPCASLKRKASKIEVNDHEDKIVITATESPVDTKQSDAVNAITSALSESEPEPSTKRVKTSHPPSKIASHATTAVVGAVLGALSTIALLAALPTEYFQ